MSLDLDALEKVAQEATPGPWRPMVTPVSSGSHWYVVDAGQAIASITSNDTDDSNRKPDAEHIAAFDPPTVLELIEDMRAIDGARARWRGLFMRVKAERDALQAKLDRVREYAEERSVYAKTRNNTVGSWRIASDLFRILGVTLEEENALEGEAGE